MGDYLCPYRTKTGGGYLCPIRAARARSQKALACDPADNAECARRYAAAATAPVRAEIKEHDRARKGGIGEWEPRG